VSSTEETAFQDIHGKIQNARLVALTSVIVAIAVNIIAVYFVDYPLATVGAILVIFIITVFLLTYLSGFNTTISGNFVTRIICDGETGELTNYPDHVTQSLIRQTVDILDSQGQNVKPRIVEALGQPLTERNILTEIAEVIILGQISTLLSTAPREFLQEFEETSNLPPPVSENSVVMSILRIDNAVTRHGLINEFRGFWLPRGGSFNISQNPNRRFPSFRRISIVNRFIRISVDYQVSGHWPMPSMRRSVPFSEIGGIPVSPEYENDLIQRFSHGIFLVLFSYDIHAELTRPRLYLFGIMLGIPRLNRRIYNFLSFLNYFMDNIHDTPFGSLDVRGTENYLKERMNYDFIINTLRDLKSFFKREKPPYDHSNYYLK
jgi:hypothetical protein